MPNLLLIDDRVREHNIFSDAVNSNTVVVLISYKTDTFESIMNKISNVANNQPLIHVAYASHGHNNAVFSFIRQSSPAILRDINDATLSTWNEFIMFLQKLKTRFNTTTFDFLACDIYSFSSWKMIINHLMKQTDLIIRASDDKTGNIHAADWIMETHNVNVKELYFTDKINKYIGTLFKHVFGTNTFDYKTDFIMGYGTPEFFGSWGEDGEDQPGPVFNQNTNLGNGSNCYAETEHGICILANGTVQHYGIQNNVDFTPIPYMYECNEMHQCLEVDVRDRLLNVSGIYANYNSFCAINSSGLLVSWGYRNDGGSMTVYQDGVGYHSIYDRINDPMKTVLNVYSSKRVRGFVVEYTDNSIDAWGYSLIADGFMSEAENAVINASIVNMPVTKVKFVNNGCIVLRESTTTSTNKKVFVFGPVMGAQIHSISMSTELFNNINDFDNNGNKYPIDIATTEHAAAVLMNDGTIYSWGDSGQSNFTNATGLHTTYNQVLNGGPFNRLYSTHYAFCALNTSGIVIAWGSTNAGGFLETHDVVYLSGGGTALVGRELVIEGMPPSDIVQVYSTAQAFVGRKSDGSLIAWGDAYYGGTLAQVNPAEPDTFIDVSSDAVNVMDVAATFNSFVALKTDNTVLPWGGFSGVQHPGFLPSHLQNESEPINVRKLYTNDYAVFALIQSDYVESEFDPGMFDGRLVMWGYPHYGGLNMTQAPVSANVKRVITGNKACIVEKTDGTFYMIGNSNCGVQPYTDPTVGITQIVANQVAFAAITADKQIKTYGLPFSGGSLVSNEYPYGITPTNIVAVVPSTNSFAALDTNGAVYSWGYYNGNRNTTPEHADSIAELQSGIVKIFGSSEGFHAIDSTGQLFSWGYDGACAIYTEGEIVTRYRFTHPDTSETIVVADQLTSGVIHVFTAQDMAAALKDDGSVVAWGNRGPFTNFRNIYGDNNWIDVRPHLTGGVIQIVSAYNAFAALKNDGSVIVWGDPDWCGSLTTAVDSLEAYINEIDNYYIPASVSNPVVKLHAAEYGFAALRKDGTVMSWGKACSNYKTFEFTEGLPQAIYRNPADITNVVKIFTNKAAFAALRRDGTVITWGETDYGGGHMAQAHPDTGQYTIDISGLLTDVKDITSTNYSFCALKRDGTTVTWGGNDADVSSGLSEVKQIYSNQETYLAVHLDGSTTLFGSQSYGASFQTYKTLTNVLTAVTTPTFFGILTPSDLSLGFSSELLPTENVEKLRLLRNPQNRFFYTDDGFYALGDSVYNPNMINNETYLVLNPVPETDLYSLLLSLDVGVNWYIPIENGEVVVINGVNYTSYDGYVYSLSEGIMTKVTTITIGSQTFNVWGGSIVGNVGSGGSGGGDPHIKTIYNNHFILPNKVCSYVLYNDLKHNIKVIGHATYLKPSLFDKMHTMKGNQIVPVSNRFKQFIQKYTYFTRLTIEHGTKRIIYDGLTNTFFNNTEFTINQKMGYKKGLYSIFHKRHYNPSAEMKTYEIELGSNKLVIKSDPYYDEFNEISIVFNDQQNIKYYKGLFFATNNELVENGIK
jgi:alpha-tubulin suppressor-like RCC1 family protein